ncbi:MAG TPA: ATP-binding protein [Mycobacteriales bacterium]|nr:ATP-binding protein [Mycobacteriales bacterium]
MDVPPQRVHTTLPSARASARDARRFVSETLRAWHVPDDPVDTACLLATELVTNAVLHAGSDVELLLEGSADTVRIEVVDSSAEVPEPRAVSSLLGTTGRGLNLVKGLSTTWGVTPHNQGKSVWFELSTR